MGIKKNKKIDNISDMPFNIRKYYFYLSYLIQKALYNTF